jgi:hypothetical protein
MDSFAARRTLNLTSKSWHEANGGRWMRMLRYAALLLGVLLLADAFSQTDSAAGGAFGLEPGEYAVGFRLLEERDDSRAVTGGIAAGTHPRPIRVYLWYPAAGTEDAAPMRFGRFVSLADEDIWPAEISGALREALGFSRRALARSLGPEAMQALAERPVRAVENAQALEGPFSLIVIAQGLYYESPIAFAALAEHLAGRGFVVATTPLVGTDSPIVKLELPDLETQVRDLEFVIARARRLPFVSAERLGVFGFDMGGMAGLILAMRNPDVDALLTADAGILHPHPSGLPAAAPDYDPSALRASWMHATNLARAAPPDELSEANSLFARAVHSDRYLLLSEVMGHVDYTSYALMEDRSAVPFYWAAATPELAAAHRVFAQYVYEFFASVLDRRADSLAALSRAPRELSAGVDLTLEHRAAIPPSISHQELVQKLVAGRADDAVNELRALAALNPDHARLDEPYLWRLGVSLLFTWGLAEEFIPVAELMLELYPSSAEAHALLGEAYILTGNYEGAAEVYRGYLEYDPDNALSRSRLGWLRDRTEAEVRP